MKTMLIVMLGIATAMYAVAGPELTGTPDELTAHLRSIPGQVTLSADAEAKVEADRAEVILKLQDSDRSFKTALARNQQRRSDIVTTLEKSGIPTGHIHMSRFSTTPTQGYFTSKVKAYEVESSVTIEAVSEKEIQSIAALVDDMERVTLLSLTFSNSQKDKHTAQVLQEALAKVNSLKEVYEKELGITLAARAVGPQPAPDGMDFARCRPYGGKEVSGIASAYSAPDTSVVLHALMQREPDLSQFDQIVYQAKVTVTFDVVKADR